MMYTLSIGMMQSNCPSLSSNVIYRLTMHCVLGLGCHGAGVVLMDTCSLLLRFRCKPPYVMHDCNVISNPKFARW